MILTDQLPTGLLRRVALEAGRRLVTLAELKDRDQIEIEAGLTRIVKS